MLVSSSYIWQEDGWYCRFVVLFYFQKSGCTLKFAVPRTCCVIFLGFNEKNVCAVNSTFSAELGRQWKHFNWVGNLICLTVASYLRSSCKGEWSLELACDMEWSQLPWMGKTWYSQTRYVFSLAGFWRGLSSSLVELTPSSCYDSVSGGKARSNGAGNKKGTSERWGEKPRQPGPFLPSPSILLGW